MPDEEFLAYLNLMSVFEIIDICKRFNSFVVLEDGRVTGYYIYW